MFVVSKTVLQPIRKSYPRHGEIRQVIVSVSEWYEEEGDGKSEILPVTMGQIVRKKPPFFPSVLFEIFSSRLWTLSSGGDHNGRTSGVGSGRIVVPCQVIVKTIPTSNQLEESSVSLVRIIVTK